MVIELLFNILFGVVNTLLNFLPVLDFSSIGGFQAIITSLVACSAFMPLSAFQVSISVFLGIQALKMISSTVNWVLRKFLLG